MKKLVLIVGVFLISTLAFGQGFGLGAVYSATGNRLSGSLGNDKVVESVTIDYIGVSGFVDLNYLLVNVGYNTGLTYQYNITAEESGETINASLSESINVTQIEISLLGKLPLPLSNNLTLFPMVGLTYTRILSFENLDLSTLPKENKDLLGIERFWLEAGLGADLSITQSIFLRLSGNVAYGLNNETERKAIQEQLQDTPGLKFSILNYRLKAGVFLGFRL